MSTVIAPQETAPSHHLPPAVRGEATNSAQNFPNFEPAGPSPAGWGSDMLYFSFPISHYDRDVMWGHRKHRPRGESYEHCTRWIDMPLGPKVAVLKVYWAHGQRWGSIEFNPSRIVDPHGAGLCAVTDLPHILTSAWRACSRFVSPLCDLPQAMVKRLDVARDFLGVRDFTVYADAWPRLLASHARQSIVHFDPRTGSPQTLYKGNLKDTCVRMYDKFAQSPGKVQAGTVRFEVQAGPRWCKKVGIEMVEDLSSDTVWDLLQTRFHWAKCSSPVLSVPEFISRLKQVRDDKGELWSQVKIDAFLGHFYQKSMGVAGKLSKDRNSKYNRVLRELGVPSDRPWLNDRASVRLDLETGREVVDGVA